MVLILLIFHFEGGRLNYVIKMFIYLIEGIVVQDLI